MKQHIYVLSAVLSLAATACSSGVPNQSSVVPATGSVAAAEHRSGGHTNAAVKGDVFTMSNSGGSNAVLRYARSADGTLHLIGTFPTGGSGSGTSLNGAGHTVNYGNAGSFLFVADAGSNDVASFAVSPTGMHLIGRFPSGGTTPASIAVSRGTLYVLNIGSNSISGFRIESDGTLGPLAGSTRSLTGSASDEPADLIFRADGSALFVPQEVSNVIDTFAVRNGVAGAAIAHSSNGTVPFGSAPTSRGDVLNTEASGKVPGASAMSSYSLGSDGSLSVVSGSVRDRQTAACWVALTHDEAFAFAANTGSNTISSYSIGLNGTLALIRGAAATEPTGSAPSDVAVSSNDQFVYVLNEGTHTIGAFRAVGHGALTKVQTVGRLPSTAVGIAAQ